MTQDFRLVLLYVPAVAPDTALVMAVLATALFLFISSSKSVSGICLKKEIMCLVSCTIEQKTSQIHNLLIQTYYSLLLDFFLLDFFFFLYDFDSNKKK